MSDVGKLIGELEKSSGLGITWDELLKLEIPDEKKSEIQIARLKGMRGRWLKKRIGETRPKMDEVRADVGFLFGLTDYLFDAVRDRERNLERAAHLVAALRRDLSVEIAKREALEKEEAKPRILLPGQDF